ncbi:MAG: hypothetical protein LWW85_10480, partial [Marinilabiliales bacterium]|nr:hypothetical protein [Marinilabiliales bacterium]
MLKLVKRTVGLLSLLHPLCAWNSHGQSLPIQSIPFAGNGYRMESAEHNSVQPVPSGKRNFLLSFCVDRDCEANLFAVADRRATLAPLRIWVENRLLKVKNSSAAG